MPTVDELEALYASGYRLHTRPECVKTTQIGSLRRKLRQAAFMAYRIRWGPRVGKRSPPPNGAVLEIGFGSAMSLLELWHRGWKVAGLEIASDPVAGARQLMPDGDFRVGSVNSAAFEPASFDLILLSHVLEHLDDPVGALSRARSWLRPEGRLVVAVPNRASVLRRVFGAYWYGYQHPEHLLQFDTSTLTVVLQEAGFRIERVRPQPYLHGLGDTLGNALDPRWRHPNARQLVRFAAVPLGTLVVLLGDAAAIEVEAALS